MHMKSKEKTASEQFFPVVIFLRLLLPLNIFVLHIRYEWLCVKPLLSVQLNFFLSGFSVFS